MTISVSNKFKLGKANLGIINSMTDFILKLIEVGFEEELDTYLTVTDEAKTSLGLSSDLIKVNAHSCGGFGIYDDQPEHALYLLLSVNGKQTEVLLTGSDFLMHSCGLVTNEKPKLKPAKKEVQNKKISDNVTKVNFGNKTLH